MSQQNDRLSTVLASVLLIALTGLAPWVHAKGAESDRGKVFVGYLFRQPEKINYRLYTHLCHAFLVADENGKIRTGRGVPSRSI
ncbi:MAG: hypothetical protein ACP5XB_03460, partial [Isosphaeraceae bacterium]